MYYALIMLAVFMFGGCFAMSDAYRRLRGDSLKISLECSFITALASAAVLFIMNGCKFEYTHFTLILAVASSLNSLFFTYCSFKALGRINLSLYSLFSMLGGMALPFIQGIFFYDEALTLSKAVAFAFILLALLLTVKPGNKKGGTLYYAGIFILNGLSGVLSKIFSSSALPKTSATGYSLLSCITALVISAAALALMHRQKTPGHTPLSLGIAAANGAVNKIANLILIISLSRVDASVQYPMVTGGVMIVSTLIAFFDKSRKPSKKELISVSLAFLGTLALFIIPI